jgi:hypothetical protein
MARACSTFARAVGRQGQRLGLALGQREQARGGQHRRSGPPDRARLRARGPRRAHRSLGGHEGQDYGPDRTAGDYGFKPRMTWEFLSVAMTAVPRGAAGELNQNGAPPATCPGVQMNCLVIMKVQAGCCTQARTPVRSA